MTQQERSRKARAKWQRLISEQARSGQRVSAFCRERGLCRPYFFAWKKRLRERAAAKFVEVKVAGVARREPRGLQGTLHDGPSGDARVEIRLLNGRSLVVGRGCDVGHLRALLAVVEAAG
jgi:hypothetical protein